MVLLSFWMPATAGKIRQLRGPNGLIVRRNPMFSVAEVANAGQDHGQSQAVGGGDDFIVPDGASGLDYSGSASFGDLFHAVRKGKESIRGGDSALQRQNRLHGAYPGGVHPAHLAGAHADTLPIPGVDDGVRLHVLANFPSKE